MIKISGTSNSTIFLVADSPTELDMSKEEPLKSEEFFLRPLFKEAGLSWENTYKTYLYKERLSYNGKDKKRKAAAVEELRAQTDWATILNSELEAIEPNIVVPIGEFAFGVLTGSRGITKFRGSILDTRAGLHGGNPTKARKVIPILGSSYWYAEPYNKLLTRIDLGRIKKYEHHEGSVPVPGKVWICKSSDELRNFLARQRNPELLVFDIETKYGIPTCISFCFDGKESVCIPFLDGRLDSTTQIYYMQQIARVLGSNVPKVNQNIKYDAGIMDRFGFYVKNIVSDTSLKTSIIYPELPRNLGFLASIYTEMPYFKDEGKEFSDDQREKFYLYNAKDSLSTYIIHLEQEKELHELGMHDFFYQKLFPLFPFYRELDERGFKIDLRKREELTGRYITEIEVLEAELARRAGRRVNPNAPAQVSKLVYEDLGFKGEGTDEEILKDLEINKCENNPGSKEILEIIRIIRRLYKVLQDLERPLHPDGRLRCSYNLGGTETGRSSSGACSDRLLWEIDAEFKMRDLGKGFQLISKHGFKFREATYGKDFRQIIIPDDGYSFVEVDLSQAEARVDAVLAKEFEFLKLFDIKPGVHCLTGSWVLECKPEDIKKGTEEYHLGKTVRHAGERNMHGGRLSMMIHKSKGFCDKVLAKFHEAQPNIRGVFHAEIKAWIERCRFLDSPHGRRRTFFGNTKDILNEAISQIPQATVSDQMKFSIPLIHKAAPWALLVYEGHDALMYLCPRGREREFKEITKPIIERPIDFSKCSLERNFDLVIPAEYSVSSKSWYDMEDL